MIRKFLQISSVFFFCVANGYAAESTRLLLSVPFQNIFLKPNVSIQANFAFGKFSVIFCFATNTQIIGRITWPFKNVPRSAPLPVFLIKNNQFQGSFADLSGVLTIVNTSNQLIEVGCLFAY